MFLTFALLFPHLTLELLGTTCMDGALAFRSSSIYWVASFFSGRVLASADMPVIWIALNILLFSS